MAFSGVYVTFTEWNCYVLLITYCVAVRSYSSKTKFLDALPPLIPAVFTSINLKMKV